MRKDRLTYDGRLRGGHLEGLEREVDHELHGLGEVLLEDVLAVRRLDLRHVLPGDVTPKCDNQKHKMMTFTHILEKSSEYTVLHSQSRSTLLYLQCFYETFFRMNKTTK